MGLAAGLVTISSIVGWMLLDGGANLVLPFPPLLARWLPHVGPGTPVAIAVALAVITWGPDLAARLAWRPLLLAAWAAASAWTVALALVDGWQRGIVERLTSTEEYLHDVGLVPDIPMMLRVFSDHILSTEIDPAQTFAWTTHVAAHPPGAFLLFVGLDRIGLGSGGAAGIAVMLVGSSACAAVAVTLRTVGHEDLARRVVPFSVLFPGAVWVGVSADGMFAAWLAWGVALLAVGLTARGTRADLTAVAGGLLLGYALHLSYGLVLGGLIPLALLLAAPHERRARATTLAALGVLIVVAVFTAAGFWWFDGYGKVRLIYAASIAQDRPYAYFVWANLGAALLALGPAVVAGLRRVRPAGPGLLILAALASILLADLSGLSKAEVERIWLPFLGWLVVACGLLPRAQARWWLIAQAALALAVNHLLLTVW
ncbi:MAG TPA: hypothetical protein VEZ42_02255 [Pseudonocardia sp.]|nr:hypothetical protein [Pseudonocardia sp.]